MTCHFLSTLHSSLIDIFSHLVPSLQNPRQPPKPIRRFQSTILAMVQCNHCEKVLANRASLRVHVNSQHSQTRLHFCECGKGFLDPAGRSRCRSRHSRTYGCSAPGCYYQNPRKDSVTQHIRRRHQSFPVDLHPVILPPNKGGWEKALDSHFELALALVPAPPIQINPAGLLPAVADFPQHQFIEAMGYPYPPQASMYSPEASPNSWNGME